MTDPLKSIARRLRRDATDAEKRLWGMLRNRQMGVKFRRQVVIGRFVVDFACLEKKLVIEVDGGQHFGEEGDIERTARLKEKGFKVIRFWNHEVLRNEEGVAAVIRGYLDSNPASPRP